MSYGTMRSVLKNLLQQEDLMVETPRNHRYSSLTHIQPFEYWCELSLLRLESEVVLIIC